MLDNNNSESRNALTVKDISKELDKNINLIKNENHEIREAFIRLKENYMMLKKKVSITKMKINEVFLHLKVEWNW